MKNNCAIQVKRRNIDCNMIESKIGALMKKIIMIFFSFMRLNIDMLKIMFWLKYPYFFEMSFSSRLSGKCLRRRKEYFCSLF